MIRILQALAFAAVFSKQACAASTTVTSSSVDTLGKGDTMFLLIPTTIANAATSVKVQESVDDSAWTDVDGAALSTLPGDTDDGKLFGIRVSRDKTGHRRYLRLSYTHGGSGSATLEALAIHDHSAEFPITAAQAGFDGALTLS